MLAKGYTGREVRYALLRVNYGLPLNFTFDGHERRARGVAAHRRLARAVDRSRRARRRRASRTRSRTTNASSSALDDDLNISGALGQLFEVVRESNRALDEGKLSPAHARRLLEWWKRINRTLAIEPDADANAVPPEVQALVDERAAARAEKNWKRSDELRDAIAALGWIVKDTKDGQKLSRK